ncbi:unnamed protein product, partial [Brachionus calyciflorus]
MNHKISKDNIENYYEKLINEIETHTEQILTKQFISDNLKLSINQERELIITKIKDIEKLNLSCLNFEPFCFFVPNHLIKNESDMLTPMKDSKFSFHNQIGRSIILKISISQDLVEEIKKFITKTKKPDFFFFDSFTEVLKYHVILELIEKKFNDLIIDLSNLET